MRNARRTRLTGALLACALACALAVAPMPLMAAVYKCTHDGQTVYSESPCGAGQQTVKPDVVVVPSSQPAQAHEAAQKSWGMKDLLHAVGLDSRDGIIFALLIGIPLSILAVFFMTRRSGPPPD